MQELLNIYSGEYDGEEMAIADGLQTGQYDEKIRNWYSPEIGKSGIFNELQHRDNSRLNEFRG